MQHSHRSRQPKVRITAPMKLIFSAAQKQRLTHHHRTLGLNHWVTALRELFPILPGTAWDDIKVMDIRSKLKEGDAGPVLSKDRVLSEAAKLAKAERLPAPTAYELVRVVLGKARHVTSGSGEAGAAVAGEARMREEPSPRRPAAVEAPSKAPVAKTPTLDRYGRDLTAEARQGLLCRIVARSEQVDLMVESLCRTTKRNVALIGPSGVGKRGIVECLAARIRDGAVAPFLVGVRLVEVHFVALIAGITSFEQLSARVATLAEETQDPKIVLFFDDLRAVMAAGSEGPGAAIAGQLKPDIVSGKITCIVSGSEEDYRRITEVDPTWQHWFQTIRVDELTPAQTLEALDAIAEQTAATRDVQVPRPVRKWIVDFAAEFMKSHRFPGKAADLLEQSVAHAVSQGAKKVTLRHAHAVAERAIGVPTDVPSRLGSVATVLTEADILAEEDRRRIEQRLSVTLRSLDLRPERPNAVILLAGNAASRGHDLAEVLATGIAGSPDRVISIDLSAFDDPWDLRRLVGPFEGKPATHQSEALLRLVDAPWSVVLFENVDACHAHVRVMITRALESGYFTDVTGRKIHLSDSIVVFTAPTLAPASRSRVGFADGAGVPEAVSAVVSNVLGREMAALLDDVITDVTEEGPAVNAVRKRLFDDLARRYRSRGLQITWDPGLVEWLDAGPQQRRTQDDWDEWADRELATALIPHLPEKTSAGIKRVTVGRDGSGLVVTEAPRNQHAR